MGRVTCILLDESVDGKDEFGTFNCGIIGCSLESKIMQKWKGNICGWLYTAGSLGQLRQLYCKAGFVVLDVLAATLVDLDIAIIEARIKWLQNSLKLSA